MLNAGTIPCASAWLVLSAKHCPFPSLLCCMRPAFCSFFTATTRIGLSFSCEPLPLVARCGDIGLDQEDAATERSCTMMVNVTTPDVVKEQASPKRLTFNNPTQREEHIRAFRRFLPTLLQDAPDIDWDLLPSPVMGYLISHLADHPDLI